MQVGPAVNGTALRDVTGLVNFNDFVNQVEYSDAAIALNDKMKAAVLADLDRRATWPASRSRCLGPRRPSIPQLITITPVKHRGAP